MENTTNYSNPPSIKLNDNEFLKWIEGNSRFLFEFFAKQCPYFPHHCLDVAYVLGHLYEQYTGKQATLWRVTKKHYKTNWHIVLEVAQHIVDFSLFQFYATKAHIKKIDNRHELYEFCIEECQNGQVIFPEKQYFTRFKKNIVPVHLQQDIDSYYKGIPETWFQTNLFSEAINILESEGYLKKIL